MRDAQIVRAIQNGSESAMNQTMNKYAKLLWHIVATILSGAGSAEDIEECVADVFVYLWKHPENFNEQRGGLKTWLSTIAKSKAIDKYRQLVHQKNIISLEDEILISELTPMDEILTAEMQHTLAVAVNTLEEPDREIIVRRYYYGQKPKEIGFILDISVKQVENRLYRSKQKLRERLYADGGLLK